MAWDDRALNLAGEEPCEKHRLMSVVGRQLSIRICTGQAASRRVRRAFRALPPAFTIFFVVPLPGVRPEALPMMSARRDDRMAYRPQETDPPRTGE